MPAATATRDPWAVQLISTPQDIPAAVENLGRLLRAGSPRAAEIFSAAIVLGVIADATADAASTSPDRRREDEAAVAVMRAYRGEIAGLMRTHQARLASLGPGNPAALAQARELRATGVPKLQRAARSRDPRTDSLPDPAVTARALGNATRALAAALTDAQNRGELLVHDRARPIEKQWHEAAVTDVLPLLAAFDRAAQAARADANRDLAARGQATAAREYGGPVLDLAQALERRRATLDRPASVGGVQIGTARAGAATALPPRGRDVPTHTRR